MSHHRRRTTSRHTADLGEPINFLRPAATHPSNNFSSSVGHGHTPSQAGYHGSHPASGSAFYSTRTPIPQLQLPNFPTNVPTTTSAAQVRHDPPPSQIHAQPDHHWASAPQPTIPVIDPVSWNTMHSHPAEESQHDTPYNHVHHYFGGEGAGPIGFEFNPWIENTVPHATIEHNNYVSQYSFVVATGVYNVICEGYLAGHLLIPSLYFFRANQIFRDAGLSPYQIAYHTVQSRDQSTETVNRGRTRVKRNNRDRREESQEEDEKEPGHSTIKSQSYDKLKNDWETLIDDLVEEWRTLNIVSAMLVPGILTLFQVDGAANDPVTRSLTHWALILALWSLVYGCLYVIQFRRMRNDYTIVGWAMEAKKPSAVFWNTWIMLALPVVSLAWSVLVFMTAIIWFMWRTRATPPTDFSLSAPPLTEFVFRIITSTFLTIAIIYFVLALSRFFQYGAPMTGHWKHEVQELVEVVQAQLRFERLKRLQAKRAEQRKKTDTRRKQ